MLPAKKEASEVSTEVQAPAGEQILKSDMLIPYLMLMQGMSDLVTEGKAVPGQMVRSTTGEALGNPKEPIEIIPLTFQNLWVVTKIVPGNTKGEYIKTLPRDGGLGDAKKEALDQTSENLRWEFEYLGQQYKRTKLLNVFALAVEDLESFTAEVKKAKETGEMPDLNKAVMPVVIGFRNMSYKAGKKVVDHFTKAASMATFGAKAHGFTLKLGCHQEKNDKGTFYVYEVNQGRRCTKEELAQSDEWYGILKSQKVRVHEEAVGDDAVADPLNDQF